MLLIVCHMESGKLASGQGDATYHMTCKLELSPLQMSISINNVPETTVLLSCIQFLACSLLAVCSALYLSIL